MDIKLTDQPRPQRHLIALLTGLNRHSAAAYSFVFLLSLFTFGNPVHAQSNEQTRFPYQAFVLNDAAEVHSGPGQVHYSTQSLAEGSVVEVYRHDPGGWCQIRPVEGSFSLVPEAALEIVADGVGQIRADNTKAWVGTKLGPVEKPLWQVKLQKGEMVEVVGQVSWPHPEGHSTTWFQISPPAGEFRWIRMSDIQLPAGSTSSVSATEIQSRQQFASDQQTTDARSQTVRSLNDIIEQSPAIQLPLVQAPRIDLQVSARTEVMGPTNLVQQAALQTELPLNTNLNSPRSTPSNSGWRQSTRTISPPPKGGYSESQTTFEDEFSQRSLKSALSNQQNLASAEQRAPVDLQRFASADISAPNLAREFDSSLRSNNSAGLNPGLASNGQSRSISAKSISELEFQLTREMVKEPFEWQLNDLEQAATTFAQSTSNPVERSQAARYLTKIANCKKIQTGYANSSSQVASTNAGPVGSGLNNAVQLGTTYDAHGWLTELVRDGGNSRSSYALQDANGKITHHISSAPGMNLHRYLKKHVGIIGQRGYHNQLKLDHVTAHRIIELNDSNTLLR